MCARVNVPGKKWDTREGGSAVLAEGSSLPSQGQTGKDVVEMDQKPSSPQELAFRTAVTGGVGWEYNDCFILTLTCPSPALNVILSTKASGKFCSVPISRC